MQQKIMATLIVGLIWLVSAAPVAAGPGQSSAQILQQTNGARPSGMGGAYVAAAGDVYTIGANPAGLSALSKTEIAFLHVGGMEGLSTELLLGALQVPELGVLGLQALYRGQPSIDNYVANESPVEVKDIVLGLTYASSLMENLDLGVNAKVLSLTLGPANAQSLALDIGVQYHLDQLLGLGCVVRNIGPGIKYNQVEDPMPLAVALGANYLLPEQGPHQLQLAMEGEYVFPEENFSLHLGGEYRFQRVLALRLGYVYSLQRMVHGLSAGVGFRFPASEKITLFLDYTFLPVFWEETDFESENLIALGMEF